MHNRYLTLHNCLNILVFNKNLFLMRNKLKYIEKLYFVCSVKQLIFNKAYDKIRD